MWIQLDDRKEQKKSFISDVSATIFHESLMRRPHGIINHGVDQNVSVR